MENIHVYGIKNCNTVKKALDWLNKHGMDYTFHDYKKTGVSEDKLKIWQKKLGWEPLVNKKGTTWRSLTESQQQLVTDATSARELMLEKNSVIKRPVVEFNDQILLGFDEEAYSQHLL